MLYGCVLEESGTMFWCGTFKLVPKLTEGVLNDLKRHIIKACSRYLYLWHMLYGAMADSR